MGLRLSLKTADTRKHIMFGYEQFDEYTLKVLYYNSSTGASREYIVLTDYPVPREALDEARTIAEEIYGKLRENAPVPNIPLYALIILLLRSHRGITYKCKVRKTSCPIRIFRVEKNALIKMSVQSIIEQVYRIMKKYYRSYYQPH